MWKQISSHLKMKSLSNYSQTNHIYIHLNVYKQRTDGKLLLLHSNTWNYLTVCKKKMSSDLFKNDINKMKTKPNRSTCLQIIYAYICVSGIWSEITYQGWYAIKNNKPKFSSLVLILVTSLPHPMYQMLSHSLTQRMIVSLIQSDSLA